MSDAPRRETGSLTHGRTPLSPEVRRTIGGQVPWVALIGVGALGYTFAGNLRAPHWEVTLLAIVVGGALAMQALRRIEAQVQAGTFTPTPVAAFRNLLVGFLVFAGVLLVAWGLLHVVERFLVGQRLWLLIAVIGIVTSACLGFFVYHLVGTWQTLRQALRRRPPAQKRQVIFELIVGVTLAAMVLWVDRGLRELVLIAALAGFFAVLAWGFYQRSAER